jgi:hypothetical protein
MQQNATPYSYFIINDQYNAACVGRTVACFHSQGVQDPRFFWWVGFGVISKDLSKLAFVPGNVFEVLIWSSSPCSYDIIVGVCLY